MTQEDKKLLFKDLCARLPYGVKVCIDKDGYEIGRLNCIERFVDEKSGECWCGTIGIYRGVDLKRIKPYLRPMSSMTEEEEKVFNDFLDFQAEYVSDADLDNKTDMFDWLNENHFDYRGLIEKGLAIDSFSLNIY